MSADRLFPSCTQTIGLTAAKTALLKCFLFLVVSPRRERDRSEDKHLRDEFRARVGHRHGECVLPPLWPHFNPNGESSSWMFSREEENVVCLFVCFLKKKRF